LVEAKNYKCVKQWCASEVAAKESEIDSMKTALSDHKVAVSQHTSRATLAQYVIDKNSKEIEHLSNSVEQANAMRDQEKEKYDKEKAINMQSTASIEQAINIVERVQQVGGFLQNGQLRRMQLNEPGESGFVLGVFKSLYTNLKRNQADSEKDETEKTTKHSQLVQTKQAELTDTQQESAEKSMLMTQSKTALEQANSDIQTITEDLKEWEQYLAETQGDCTDKEKEWQIRGEDRSKEKAAIREAVSFLKITFEEKEQQETQQAMLIQKQDELASSSDELSFVQVGMASFGMGQASALVGTADAELAALTAQVNGGASDDSFGEVKGTINKLIAVVQTQQKAEAEKKKYCEKEKKSRLNEQESTTDILKALNATINKKSIDVKTLITEANELNASIIESKARDEVAGKLRKEQSKLYADGTRDRKLALRVLREATSVLARFYKSQDSTKLLQKGGDKVTKGGDKASPEGEAMPDSWSGSSRKSGESNVVLAMLEKIAEDIDMEQKDAEKEENEAEAAWQKHRKESKAEYDTRMREITLRVTRKAQMLVQLDNHKEEKGERMSTLQSLEQQLAGLASECDLLVKNFEEATKDRTFQVAQLRDVIDILSGSSIAARTGLIQQPAGGGDGAAAAGALQDMSRAIDGLERQSRSIMRLPPTTPSMI